MTTSFFNIYGGGLKPTAPFKTLALVIASEAKQPAHHCEAKQPATFSFLHFA